MLTHKYYSDRFYKNSDFALMSGISLQELNFLEAEFLECIDCKLTVDRRLYEDFKNGLTDRFTPPINEEIVLII